MPNQYISKLSGSITDLEIIMQACHPCQCVYAFIWQFLNDRARKQTEQSVQWLWRETLTPLTSHFHRGKAWCVLSNRLSSNTHLWSGCVGATAHRVIVGVGDRNQTSLQFHLMRRKITHEHYSLNTTQLCMLTKSISSDQYSFCCSDSSCACCFTDVCVFFFCCITEKLKQKSHSWKGGKSTEKVTGLIIAPSITILSGPDKTILPDDGNQNNVPLTHTHTHSL